MRVLLLTDFGTRKPEEKEGILREFRKEVSLYCKREVLVSRRYLNSCGGNQEMYYVNTTGCLEGFELDWQCKQSGRSRESKGYKEKGEAEHLIQMCSCFVNMCN